MGFPQARHTGMHKTRAFQTNTIEATVPKPLKHRYSLTWVFCYSILKHAWCPFRHISPVPRFAAAVRFNRSSTVF
jgi:hypothetical protein